MIPLYESSTFCAFAVNQSNLGKCLSTLTVVKYSISVLDKINYKKLLVACKSLHFVKDSNLKLVSQ